MNHLGDANKMVSETPRMDEFIGEHSEWSPAPRKNWHAFARQLERELRTANARIKRLEEALSRIANQDYRGNRSTESQIAFEALKEAK